MSSPLPRRILPLLLVLPSLWANGLPRAAPESVGLSSARLDRVTKAIEADIKSNRIPGALALIARRGKVAYLEARGFADRETQIPIREDTIFRIYSMTKPITSVGLMLLYEEGKFMLRDPVSKYIPEMGGLEVLVENDAGNRLVKAKREMTIQDLLRHTSGLTYGFFSDGAVDEMYAKLNPKNPKCHP